LILLLIDSGSLRVKDVSKLLHKLVRFNWGV
jgi:hypothetical protein